jgi:exodeoxyribonuclease VII small subunit
MADCLCTGRKPDVQHPMTTPAPTPAKSPRARASTGVSAGAAEPATSYEAALQELEQLVAQLDAGQLPLDQLLTRYQRGTELLGFCRARLDAVEQQIKVLEAGEFKPWEGA